MTNAVALPDQWDPASGAALPAHLADALGELGGNIPDRNTVPSLSYEGKTWTIVKDGNKTKLQAVNSDGDNVPVPVMRVVVLNFNAERGRAFYEGLYNPAASSAPKCWSADGKAPDASVKDKQSALCTGCPQSIKGSKVTDGKEMVACSSHRMIAIIPANDLAFDPLRLKIAVTSDYDKDVVEHGWFAFRQYVDFLKSRGVAHTALVVTKIKFDPNPAYPKLLFAIDRPLTPTEVADVILAAKSPKVTELLAEKWTAAGTAGTEKSEADIKPHGLEGAYLDGWAAHPDVAGYSWKGAECLLNADVAALYPEPAPPPAPATKPAAEQVIEHEAAPAAPEPEAVAPPVVSAHDPLTNAMANGWAVHPTNPAYYFKDQEVISTEELIAKYPAPAAVAPAAPAAPAAPLVEAVDPLAAAEADGWAVHPDNAAYHFKGAEVVERAALEARYAGNGAGAAPTPPTPAPAAATAPGASPSSAEVPADVQNLLDKWTGG